MRLMLALVVLLVGGTLFAQTDREAIVITTQARASVNSYGDALIVTDVTARDAAGGTHRWTATGGTLDGYTLVVSHHPRFTVGQRVQIRNGLVLGGTDFFQSNGHTWASSTVGYEVNPTNRSLAPDALLAAIQQSAAAWSTQAAPAVQLVYLGLSSATAVGRDGRNAVFFRYEPTIGLLAATHWWYDGTGHLVDADIYFNEAYPFLLPLNACSGAYYVANTATHEFGHALGLGHSTIDEATMWPYSGSCETIRETLAADDIVGIETLYPGGVIITEPPPDPDPVPIPEPKPCRGRGRRAC